MAIPILNHLDFRYSAEAQNLILHKTTEASATNTEGAIIYDTGTDTVKYRNGSSEWVSLTASTSVTVSDSNTSSAFPIVFHDESNNLLDDTGTFTYNPNSGQLVAPGEIVAASLDISGNVDIDGTLEADAYTVNGTALNTYIAGITVTNATNASAATLASTVTVTDSSTNTSFPVVFHDESNALLDDTGSLEYNPSSGLLSATTFSGSLSGTATAAATATNANNIAVSDESSDTTCFPLFVTSDSGNNAAKVGSNLTFNSSSGLLTATSFAGALTGDVTGNVAGNVTGNLIIGGHTVDDIDITSEASDADDHLMTALAIKNRIEDYGYTTDANVTHRTVTAGGNTLAQSETLAFTAGSNISISESGGAVTITGTDTNTNTGADMTNATLLTKLAALESTSGAADENIVIGTDSGDTIVITGNLQVSGTTTTVDSTTVTLGDHNIVLDSGNSTSAVVADAGITLEGGSGSDVTWMWDASNTAMTLKLGSDLGDAAFGTIELGHATDTTIARSGSGDITIEGNAVYRAGGTDVPVSDGGTGASSLTDGGVLLGSGTGAITAMAVLGDGEMIVGDGTGDPVAESGTTLRASIGVDAAGTDNSTNVSLSGTPDYITISGQVITRNAIDLTADVTGVLPAANLPDAGAAAEGVVELATAAEVQTGTDTARVVTPDTLAAKTVIGLIEKDNIDSTQLSAVIQHDLGTYNLIVEAQYKSNTPEYENVWIDWECSSDGSAHNDDYIYVKFASVPDYDIQVQITSVKGGTAVTATYPS